TTGWPTSITARTRWCACPSCGRSSTTSSSAPCCTPRRPGRSNGARTPDDLLVLFIFHGWQMTPADDDVQPGSASRGIYVSDPAANAWTEKPHVAGDSEGNGSMRVSHSKE